MTALCALFGISRQAYYAATKGGKVARLKGRTKRKPRPERRGEWATTAALEGAIRAKVAKHPAWGVRKIWASIRRDGVIASHKRVWAVMNRLGLVLPPLSERDHNKPRGHVSVPGSNRRWATDLTTAWTREDGWVAIVPVVDCGDRSVLAIHVTKSQEAPDVLAPLREALVAEFVEPSAVPDAMELRSDNGPQFTSADCDGLCRSWNVEQTFSPPGRPTGNAIAERLIQTLKVELVWTNDWDSLEELRAALEAWQLVYNGERPHQSLKWRTPNEQRALNLGTPVASAGAAAA